MSNFGPLPFSKGYNEPHNLAPTTPARTANALSPFRTFVLSGSQFVADVPLAQEWQGYALTLVHPLTLTGTTDTVAVQFASGTAGNDKLLMRAGDRFAVAGGFERVWLTVSSGAVTTSQIFVFIVERRPDAIYQPGHLAREVAQASYGTTAAPMADAVIQTLSVNASGLYEVRANLSCDGAENETVLFQHTDSGGTVQGQWARRVESIANPADVVVPALRLTAGDKLRWKHVLGGTKTYYGNVHIRGREAFA